MECAPGWCLSLYFRGLGQAFQLMLVRPGEGQVNLCSQVQFTARKPEDKV